MQQQQGIVSEAIKLPEHEGSQLRARGAAEASGAEVSVDYVLVLGVDDEVVEEAVLAIGGGSSSSPAARPEAVEAELGAEEREAAVPGRLEPVRHHLHLVLLLLHLRFHPALRPQPSPHPHDRAGSKTGLWQLAGKVVELLGFAQAGAELGWCAIDARRREGRRRGYIESE